MDQKNPRDFLSQQEQELEKMLQKQRDEDMRIANLPRVRYIRETQYSN